MSLSRNTRKKLIDLVSRYMDVGERRSHVYKALGNSPLLNRIDWTGSADVFTVRLIEKLENFGEIEPGYHAIASLLDEIHASIGYGVTREQIERLKHEVQRQLTEAETQKTSPNKFELSTSAKPVGTPPVASGGSAADLTRRTREILPLPFAWVEIPAGQVTLKTGGYVPEGGLTVDVPAFMIAKYPVTNAQFATFIEAGGYENKQWWTNAGWKYRQDENWTQPGFWTDDEFNGAEYPVVGVSWFEAVAFCNWLNDAVGTRNGASAGLPGRIILPTEAQWQRAAQGDDGREYPYDHTFYKNRANTLESGIGRTTPVTQYDGEGGSPFDMVDMSGNVFEWCLTDYKSGSDDVDLADSQRTLRGGSWCLSLDIARAVARVDLYPTFRDHHNGFRLVVVRS